MRRIVHLQRKYFRKRTRGSRSSALALLRRKIGTAGTVSRPRGVPLVWELILRGGR